MKILLTGGSGFIGGHLATALNQAGHTLYNFDLRAGEGGHDAGLHDAGFPGIDQRGDVRDGPALARAVAGMDLVIHLAAEHADNVEPISRYAETNVMGAANLIAALEANGSAEATAPTRVLMFSSASVYGSGTTDEHTADLRPDTPYGCSKLAAEQLLRGWQARAPQHRALRILRPSVVYGPGHHGNMSRLIDAVDRKRWIQIGSGRNTKSICFVGNLVAATLFDLAERPGLGIHNVADRPDLDMHTLTRLIRSELGRDPDRVTTIPRRLALGLGHACDALAHLGGPRVDLSAARVRKYCANSVLSASVLHELGYRPQWSHAEGIRATLAARRQVVR